ncbi:helix-turn-helix domain-containing protein [Pantoea sp. Bo_2]|uniref:Helix-turn-helix domain-containing protein n=1 Tax=Candidatus Pantoea gossypiicola TaxID=2608008 RepID=A0AB34CKP7_9GAMM|nr:MULTISPECIES: type II toxin-antitoxin system MqsA family antitoxin [Pantoea]KAA5931680.1 helix-turn-helix domain-containing protein [Pantoea sp. VH_8]KAA5936815.1 helix-turn-helix domain-containing protein [Pantoea sp. VH_4]KAA5948371.1 helix-turn-helix domain-containing protein [Pantoea sp. VH_3]KAA5953641.1 helix-turn-helix domain-containing protein [Pantoea sp. VH_25]KAA5956524.1 helix-turn-helix domain-containing protein [Pantoea sp. VH_24]
MTERDIFSELMTGMQELKDHQEGKITLKSHKVTKRAPMTIAPQELRDVREKLNLSQAVFAHYLHTGETTYQNWEQGRARPNAQAVLLIRMVQQNPEALKTLAKL